MVINFRRRGYRLKKIRRQNQWAWERQLAGHVPKYRILSRDVPRTWISKKSKCYLNGKEIRDVWYADSRRGIVRIYVRNAEGHLMVDAGEAVTKELRGKVRIVLARKKHRGQAC